MDIMSPASVEEFIAAGRRVTSGLEQSKIETRSQGERLGLCCY
jgi:hypothetical protein